jgi:DNA-binding NarL/FixJ family response regulator
MRAAASTEVLAYADSAEELLQSAPDQAPRLVLLFTEDERAVSQVRQIRTAWPGARCIALVEHAQQREPTKEAGADEALLQSLAPRRLLPTIEDVLGED